MADGTVLRAFELAREGTCKSISDIRRKLKAEGYSAIDDHFSGPTMKKQLMNLLKSQQQTSA